MAKAGFELLIHLLKPPEFQIYKCEPPSLKKKNKVTSQLVAHGHVLQGSTMSSQVLWLIQTVAGMFYANMLTCFLCLTWL